MRKLVRTDEIIRRYLVLNAFDGALATLGVVFALSILTHEEPRPTVVAGAGLATSFAMAVSGFFGAYLTERAERLSRIRKLENAMLASLDNSRLTDEAAQASISAAIIDGLSPFLTSIAIVSPYLLATVNIVPANLAFVSSTIIGFALLFGLGFFLGRLSQGNAILYGLLMAGIGLVTAIVIVIFGLV